MKKVYLPVLTYLFSFMFFVSIGYATVCVDDDGGRDYGLKTAVTETEVPLWPWPVITWDECGGILNLNSVKEATCEGRNSQNEPMVKVITNLCEYQGDNGFNCNNGACYPSSIENIKIVSQLSHSITLEWDTAEYAQRYFCEIYALGGLISGGDRFIYLEKDIFDGF